MNSATISQPATNGPASSSTNGFTTRNAMMLSLYQRGALPRKLEASEVASVRTMVGSRRRASANRRRPGFPALRDPAYRGRYGGCVTPQLTRDDARRIAVRAQL